MGLGTEAVPDHGYALFITSVVMVIQSGVFVCAPIAVRLARKTMGTDDYITFVALVSLFVCLTSTKPSLTLNFRTGQSHSFFRDGMPR